MVVTGGDTTRLTRSATKADLYAGDPYYRDGVRAMEDAAGPGWYQACGFHDVASLLIRPDALANAAATEILRRVAGHGYLPLASAVVRLNRLTVRELWRYQLNVATDQRLAVMDEVMVGRDSLHLVLRRVRPYHPGVPAAVELSDLKGPSLPRSRRPWHLRATTSCGQASVLTLVHVSDEPIDVLRDLGLLLEPAQLREAVEALRRPVTTRALDAALSACRPGVLSRTWFDYRWAPSARRLLRDATTEDRRAYLHRLLALGPGDDPEWPRIAALLAGPASGRRHLDAEALAAHFAMTHDPRARPLLPDVGLADWTEEDH